MVNTVMSSFNTIVGQMTKMSQQKRKSSCSCSHCHENSM